MKKSYRKFETKVLIILIGILASSGIAFSKINAAPSNGSAYSVGYSYPSGTYHYCALRVWANFTNGAITDITDYSYVSDLMLNYKQKPSKVSATRVRGSYRGIGSQMIEYGGNIYVDF